jgi:hypothetical protein
MSENKMSENESQSWDFGSPEEIKEALERNRKLAEDGFYIREATEDEPKPIIDKDMDVEIDKVLSKTSQGTDKVILKESTELNLDYEERYWAMFNIVKNLVEEIKFLKGRK